MKFFQRLGRSIMLPVAVLPVDSMRQFGWAGGAPVLDPLPRWVRAEVLSTGRYTHDYAITFEEAQELGLNVSDALPQEVYQLMELYPQSGKNRPSVQYIPLPYRRANEEAPKS